MFIRPSKKAGKVAPVVFRPQLEDLEARWLPSGSTAYLATDLVSDQPGVARNLDPTLVNGWGISLNQSGGAFWVSAAETGLSEVYGGDVKGSPISQPFKVTIPGGSPTGQVFNDTGSTTDFIVTSGTASRAAQFIFASESGNITGWNGGVPPGSRAAIITASVSGANFKGLALAKTASGNFLYAADFHNNKIDVFDGSWKLTTLAGSFTDPNLPAGYAAFNVQNLGGKLYVTYAKQDADAEDDLAGKGNGFVSVFDTSGNFIKRLASRGTLNSPWGLALAPTLVPNDPTTDFGQFSGALLVGNFGDGRINAFNPDTGKFLGQLSSSKGHPLVIDGLWGLAFGNGVSAGDKNALYYAAGPDDEEHGLFGKITANPEGTNPVKAELTNGELLLTGSRDNDHVHISLRDKGQTVRVRAGGEVIGEFKTADVGSIRFLGFAGKDHVVLSPHITINAVLDGGADNDVLVSGDGNDILLGGPGKDLLSGRGGRDLVIGGTDTDALLGGKDDDIVIGGTTAYDSKLADLQAILAKWTSMTPSQSYEDRVMDLKAGTGAPKLDSTTVLDDGARDVLFGGRGLDWFFATLPDVLIDRIAAEHIN
ncbi:MAG: TIGR03118 family protein [Gemmataceae bacterium]|nr:TIGR03118 family protein [Gemmataceae bacterium]